VLDDFVGSLDRRVDVAFVALDLTGLARRLLNLLLEASES
jgi:hypothetical protein